MKKFLTLCLAGVLAISIAGCGPKKADATPAPSIEPTEVIIEDNEIPVTDLTLTIFEDENVQFTVAETWAGKYYVSFSETDGHRDEATYYTYVEDKQATLLTFQLVENEDNLVEPEENHVTEVVPGDGFFLVKTTFMPEDDTAKKMIADLDLDSYLYVPEPMVVPEGAKPIVAAIKAARNPEDNAYHQIYADPEDSLFFDLLAINREDVKNFAMSISLMNVQAYSIVVVEPEEGKTDAIEEALNSYKSDIVASFENYLVDQLEVAKNGRVEKFGKYVALVICENNDEVFESIKTALS